MRSIIAATVVVLAAAPGCGTKEESLPANVPYALEIAFVDPGGNYVQDHPARGATLYRRNGQALGTVDSSDHRDRVKFTLPSTDLPSTWGALELAVQTPCGEKRIPFSYGKYWTMDANEKSWLAAQMSLGRGTVELAVRAPADAVSMRQTIRVEWEGATEPITIGTLSFKPGTSPLVVLAPDCAPDVPIMVGSKPAGTLKPTSGNAYILARPDACFTTEYLGYGNIASTPKVLVRTPHYDSGLIAFYLRPAEKTAAVGAGEQGRALLSVQSATCPPPT